MKYTLGIFLWILFLQANCQDSALKIRYLEPYEPKPIKNGWVGAGCYSMGWRYCDSALCNGIIKDYHPNGQLWREGYYEEGKLRRIIREYYDNGQERFKVKNKGNTLIEYYPNGNKKYREKTFCIDLDGEQKCYYKKIEDFFENGQRAFVGYHNTKNLQENTQIIKRYYFYKGKLRKIKDDKYLKKGISIFLSYDNDLTISGIFYYKKDINGISKKWGLWEYFDEKGNLIKTEDYKKW